MKCQNFTDREYLIYKNREVSILTKFGCEVQKPYLFFSTLITNNPDFRISIHKILRRVATEQIMLF